MISDNNFHLHFQFGSKNYDIDFIANKKIKNLQSGMHYSLVGEKESVDIVNKYLSVLSVSLDQNISETRKELRVKLWQAGAKEISFFEEIDHIRQEILGMRKPFDIQDSVFKVCACLEENYIFPDVAKKSSIYLRDELQKGAYDAMSDPDTFAQAVTADLRLLSEDKHLDFRAQCSQNHIRPKTEDDEIAFLKSITYQG